MLFRGTGWRVKRRVLVTGAAGLIGSALSRELLEAGYEIAVLDVRATTPAARGDVRDTDTLARALEGCVGVVHLAAVSRVVWGERDPAACWSVNVDGTHAVVAAAHQRRQWILFASSREVYGAAGHLPATEETPVAPINVYGSSRSWIGCESRLCRSCSVSLAGNRSGCGSTAPRSCANRSSSRSAT